MCVVKRVPFAVDQVICVVPWPDYSAANMAIKMVVDPYPQALQNY